MGDGRKRALLGRCCPCDAMPLGAERRICRAACCVEAAVVIIILVSSRWGDGEPQSPRSSSKQPPWLGIRDSGAAHEIETKSRNVPKVHPV